MMRHKRGVTLLLLGGLDAFCDSPFDAANRQQHGHHFSFPLSYCA